MVIDSRYIFLGLLFLFFITLISVGVGLILSLISILLNLFIIDYFNKKYKLKLKEGKILILVFFMLLSMFGGSFFMLYYTTIWYDKLLHFIVPLTISYWLTGYFKNKISTPFIILIVLGMSGFFEIMEYFFDVFFVTSLQGVFDLQMNVILSPLADTMQDMVFSLVGSYMGTMFYRWWES